MHDRIGRFTSIDRTSASNRVYGCTLHCDVALHALLTDGFAARASHPDRGQRHHYFAESRRSSATPCWTSTATREERNAAMRLSNCGALRKKASDLGECLLTRQALPILASAGAGEGNRTLVVSLGSNSNFLANQRESTKSCSAIIAHSAPFGSISARLRAKLRSKNFAPQSHALAIAPLQIIGAERVVRLQRLQ